MLGQEVGWIAALGQRQDSQVDVGADEQFQHLIGPILSRRVPVQAPTRLVRQIASRS